jgi:hypothetical protein
MDWDRRKPCALCARPGLRGSGGSLRPHLSPSGSFDSPEAAQAGFGRKWGTLVPQSPWKT